MASGASHDAQVVNSVVPAGMIFVPSRNGLSHVPEEWTSSADIATGANVLTETVRLLDAYLARNAADAK
jgi:allantoate deiminase